MSAVGFDFTGEEADKAVLRILCYTNYHPALIQHFCGELIKLVRSRRHEPPYQVIMDDVEAVYRREDVRGFMRERFNWTLDLDPCYGTIVYAMIMEQIHDDGYRQEFPAAMLLDLARNWWEEGFQSVTLEDVRSLAASVVYQIC